MSTFSTTEENYIKAIYHLQEETGITNTNAVAAALQTKAASVTDMMKKLDEKKILQYQKYKGFKLTALGNKTALAVIRKHRLWEYFLVEKLQFGWHQVHEVAEELEHITSKMLIDKLDDFLGNPKYDPHGDPIPNKEGKMTSQAKIKLSDLAPNTKASVCAVAEQSYHLLELLKHQNIALGTTITINQKFDFDNSLSITINNQNTFNISQQVAQVIFVIKQ